MTIIRIRLIRTLSKESSRPIDGHLWKNKNNHLNFENS
jgi:hypothetical protein